MLMKEKSERNTLEMVSVETLVPQDHLLRKIDSAVDFTHIYDFVEELYCADNGRPSVDPVSYTHLDVYKRQIEYCTKS